MVGGRVATSASAKKASPKKSRRLPPSENSPGILLRGEKKIERDEKKDTWHIVERSSGSFARKLSLSAPIDAEKIEAKFEKGVLTVMLPKQPQAQTSARKIEIKTS